MQSLNRGDVFIPNHRLAFCILFTLDSGEEVILEVPKNRFDEFKEGDTGELAWQDYMILSFKDVEFKSYP